MGVRCLSISFQIACIVLLCRPSYAAQQSIPLRSGWNLISINISPYSSSPLAIFGSIAADIEAVWGYDSAADQWARFPAIDDTPALSEVTTGHGYWVKVKRAVNLTVAGPDDVLARGAPSLRAGWNLLGFVVDAPTPYDQVLFDLPVRQIWTFDAAARRFRGIVLGLEENSNPVQEEFTNLEPGKGYWVLSGDDASMEPELATAVPGDIDLAPLLTAAASGARPPFGTAAMSAGDRDVGGEECDDFATEPVGFYDTTASQRAIDFGDFSTLVKMSIYNNGSGTMAWRARIIDPEQTPWLRFLIAGETPAEDVLEAILDGTVGTGTAELNLSADRFGLGPGIYSAAIAIDSNGAEAGFPEEPERLFCVRMEVPPLDGDYKLTATIDTINGQPADTHNPRMSLTLYRDSAGLKGIFDGQRTLLLPDYCVGGSHADDSCDDDDDCGLGGRCEHYLRLAGRTYESGTNRFTVSGTVVLPAGADDNPYQSELRRDITLFGDRPARGTALLGPEDLTGQYRETIRNVLGLPIYLEGTFVAERQSPVPSARDLATPEDSRAFDVPDGATMELVRTLNVSERVLLSEVDVRV
ncbi:MAG TPA: hypothetical protein VEB21_00335, partial [Terriglobales bacterium]|nr:hypothetical protein [Terriglobales bacterium]